MVSWWHSNIAFWWHSSMTYWWCSQIALVTFFTPPDTGLVLALSFQRGVDTGTGAKWVQEHFYPVTSPLPCSEIATIAMNQEQLIRFEIRIQIEGIISVICALPPDTPFHATFQGVTTLIEQLRGPVIRINYRHASGLSVLQSDTPRFISLRQLDTILASPVHQF